MFSHIFNFKKLTAAWASSAVLFLPTQCNDSGNLSKISTGDGGLSVVPSVSFTRSSSDLTAASLGTPTSIGGYIAGDTTSCLLTGTNGPDNVWVIGDFPFPTGSVVVNNATTNYPAATLSIVAKSSCSPAFYLDSIAISGMNGGTYKALKPIPLSSEDSTLVTFNCVSGTGCSENIVISASAQLLSTITKEVTQAIAIHVKYSVFDVSPPVFPTSVPPPNYNVDYVPSQGSGQGLMLTSAGVSSYVQTLPGPSGYFNLTLPSTNPQPAQYITIFSGESIPSSISIPRGPKDAACDSSAKWSVNPFSSANGFSISTGISGNFKLESGANCLYNMFYIDNKLTINPIFGSVSQPSSVQQPSTTNIPNFIIPLYEPAYVAAGGSTTLIGAGGTALSNKLSLVQPYSGSGVACNNSTMNISGAYSDSPASYITPCIIPTAGLVYYAIAVNVSSDDSVAFQLIKMIVK